MDKFVVRDTLSDFICNELEGEREIFQRLLGYLSKHFNEFRVAQSDPKLICRLAHKIRTGCVSFGAMPLALVFQQIEDTAEGEVAVINEKAAVALSLLDPTLSSIKEISDEIFERSQQSA